MIYRLIVFLGLTALLGACNSPSSYHETRDWLQSQDKLKVLSTIGMIDDLVKQIGGEHISSLTLIQGDLDPHSYQLVKGDDEKLAAADIIFYNGLGLEHGPSLQSYLSQSDKAHPLGNKIEKREPSRILVINGQTDPHIWMDVSLWAETVPHIVKALSDAKPEYAAEFGKNGEKVLEELTKAHEEIRLKMAQIPVDKRYLVTSHDAFNYFSKAYLSPPGSNDWDIRCTAPDGLAPESQLSTLDIKEIIDHCKEYDIKVIFPESNVSKDSIRKIVSAGREKGLDIRIADMVLYADAMGPKGSDGDTYIKMVQHNAHVLFSNIMENH